MVFNRSSTTRHHTPSRVQRFQKQALAVAVSTASALLAVPAWADTDIVLDQSLQSGTTAKSEADLTIDADSLLLKSADSKSPVQVSDAGITNRGNSSVSGGANRFALSVTDSSDATTNAIYLTQIGGSWLALTVVGTDNTLAIADLAGLGNFATDGSAGSADTTVNVKGSGTSLSLSPDEIGAIAERLLLNAGADDASLSDGDLTVVYSDFGDVVANIEASMGTRLVIDQSNWAGVLLEGSREDVDFADTVGTQTGNQANVTVSNDTSGEVLIYQAGILNEASVTTNGAGNLISLTQDNADASSVIQSDLRATGTLNAVTVEQWAGVNTATEFDATVTLNGSGSVVRLAQSAINASGDGLGLNDATVSVTGDDVELFVSQDLESTVDATNSLGLTVTASDLENSTEDAISIQQAIEDSSTLARENLATIDLDSGTSGGLSLAQRISGADLAGYNEALIDVGNSTTLGAGAVDNLVAVTQTNTTGGDILLDLDVDGDNNDVTIVQTNSSSDSSGINDLTVRLVDSGADLDIRVEGDGTNVFAIEGTGNIIEMDNDLNLVTTNSSSEFTIFGSSNTIDSSGFSELMVRIGETDLDSSDNAVTTSGNVEVAVFGGSDNSLEFTNGYSSADTTADLTGSPAYTPSELNILATVEGSDNLVGLEDRGTLALRGAYAVAIAGDTNTVGRLNNAGVMSGSFTTANVYSTDVTVTGNGNRLSNGTDAEALGALDTLGAFVLEIFGNSNSVAVWGTGDAGATLDAYVGGNGNTLGIRLGETLAADADLDIDVIGDDNSMQMNLSGGDLSYLLTGDDFAGSVETIGSSYYQLLSTLGSGTIVLESAMGKLTLASNL